MDVGPCAFEPSEMEEQHGIAAREEYGDAGPDPGKEAAEDPLPERKTQTRFERPRSGTQHHIGEEHAADPYDGGEDMKRNKHRHAQSLHQLWREIASGAAGTSDFVIFPCSGALASCGSCGPAKVAARTP